MPMEARQRVKVRVRIRPFIPNVIPSEAFQVPSVTIASEDRIVVVPPSDLISRGAKNNSLSSPVLHAPQHNQLLLSARKGVATNLPSKRIVQYPASPLSPSSIKTSSMSASIYTFDSVHDGQSSQADIFEDCEIADLIDTVLDGGINTSVLCYGPTGSGKTYSMTGSWDGVSRFVNPTASLTHLSDEGELGSGGLGILPRCVHTLLTYVSNQFGFSDSSSFQRSKVSTVQLFAFELYLDNVYDLLSPKKSQIVFRDGVSAEGGPSTLLLDLTTSSFGNDRPQATPAKLTTMSEFASAYKTITSNRTTVAHKRNDQSSRSHVIYLLRVDFDGGSVGIGDLHAQNALKHKQVKSTPPSLLALVDLAGSERIKSTGLTSDQSLQEAQFINKSLAALSGVVYALHCNNKHVPYRDSKLTRLLRPCFESAHVTAIVHVPPGPDTCDEALCTLKFAQRLKEVKLLDTVATQAGTEGQSLRVLANEATATRDIWVGFEESASLHAALAAEVRIANAQTGFLPKRLARLLRRRYLNASNDEDYNYKSSSEETSAEDYISHLISNNNKGFLSNELAMKDLYPSPQTPCSEFLWRVRQDNTDRRVYSAALKEALSLPLKPYHLQHTIAESVANEVHQLNTFLKQECAALEVRNRVEGEAEIDSARHKLKHDKKKELICLDIIALLQQRLRGIYKAERAMEGHWTSFQSDLVTFEKQNEALYDDIRKLKRECYCLKYTSHASKQVWTLLNQALVDIEDRLWAARETMNVSRNLADLQKRLEIHTPQNNEQSYPQTAHHLRFPFAVSAFNVPIAF